MKKLFTMIAVVFGILFTSTLSYGQCDFTTKIVYHNNFMDIVDGASFWFKGVEFTAYDMAGNLIGRSPLPAPSIAVRPSHFPLHVYGDDGTTTKVEGPQEGEVFFVTSNLIKDCGIVLSDSLIYFHHWTNQIVNFKHPGDVNGDRRIDMTDYKLVSKGVQVQKYFGMYNCIYDVNADGVVNASDQGLLGRVVLYNDPRSTLGKWDYGCMRTELP